MNRRLIILLELIRNKKHHPSTNNISHSMNRIHSDENYFRDSRARLYVQREMQDYPCSHEDQDRMDEHMPDISRPVKTSKLSDMIINFSVDLDYLEIEQARLWLKGLNGKQIKRNWGNFKELEKCVAQTLSEKEYEQHVIRSAREFINEIKGAQEKLKNKVI